MADEADRIRENSAAFAAAFAGDDEDTWLAYLAEDAEWVPIMAALEGRSYHGREGVRQWLADLRRDWEVFEPTQEEVRDLGGGAFLVLGRWRARGRGSGVELEQAAAWLQQWRDGRLVRLQTFTSQDEALQAAAELQEGR